jgi:hypothetical protein
MGESHPYRAADADGKEQWEGGVMDKCQWCGSQQHSIGSTRCPYVTAFEYYENGAIKRVEFEAPKHIHEAPSPPLIIEQEKPDPFRLRG